MSVPPPGEVVVVKNVPTPLRDGVTLATDLYFPARDGQALPGPFPTVLQRTPYNRDGLAEMGRYFAGHGYLSAVQDCRGRFASAGEFSPLVNEPQDGYDAIQWLAAHPASTGRIGMYGCSYMAWVQLQAATQAPPALATMIPYEGPINAWHYSVRYGGALHLGLLQWIISVAATSREARQDPSIAAALQPMLDGPGFMRWAARLPWRRGQTPLRLVPACEEAALSLYMDHFDYGDFWRQPGLGMDEYFAVYPDLPMLWVVGWYDWYARTITDGWRRLRALKRSPQHLLVGPWSHNNFNPWCGDLHFGAAGGLASYADFLDLERRWFDRWLKLEAGADVGPPVRVFIMGGGAGTRTLEGRLDHGGRWFAGESWPPPEVRPQPFYFQPDGGLAPTAPATTAAATTWTVDPHDTVSSNGRCIIAYGPALASGFSGMGPRDQRELPTLPGHGDPGMPLASRPDVVVFQTPPLAQDTEVTGDVQAVLYVSSTAPDTDFYVRVLDVYPHAPQLPDGCAIPVSEGMLRARYRESCERPVPLVPGQVYRLELVLEPTANVFRAGHCLRVDVCSSNFPNCDSNRQTGDPYGRSWRLADNTLYHDAGHPSHVVLPIRAR